MESDQQSKPKFKACLTNQKPQSPTKRKQHEAFSSSSSAAPPAQQSNDNVNVNNNVVVVNDLPPGYGGDNAVLNHLPPGYRFCPFDEELIVHYLMNKVNNQCLPPNKIMDVNLYKHNPSQLAENFPTLGEKEWYFFTPRDRKYRNGNRPNRAAGDGYWKATGADKIVKYNGEIVGYRKALVFYKGKPPKGDKTKWIMHEYRVKGEAPKTKKGTDDMRLDDWVLCRIYEKTKQARARQRDGDEEPDNPETPSVDPTSPPPPPPLLVNAEMSYNYNSVGGSNVFMANPQYVNYPPMPYHGGLVPAEMPQYSDGSLIPNYTMLNSHLQQSSMSFNCAPPLPISYKFPPSHVHPPPPPPPPHHHVHPTENTVMHGQYTTAWDLKPRSLEDDTWQNYGGCDLASQYDLDHNNYMGAFPDDFTNNLPEDVSYDPTNDDHSSL